MTPLEKTLAAALRAMLDAGHADNDDDFVIFASEAEQEAASGPAVVTAARDALALVDALSGPLRICDRVRIVENENKRFRSLAGRQGIVSGVTHYGFTVRFPGDPSRYRTSIPREFLQRLDSELPQLQAVQS